MKEVKGVNGIKLLYGKYAGTEVNAPDGKTYMIMRQSDVLAVIG